MKTPEINLAELKKLKEDNFKERLKFIEIYANWMKKKSKKWSSQQKNIIG